MVHLNRYTEAIYDEDDKTELANLMNDNLDFYQILIHLPLKSDPPAVALHSGKVSLDLDSNVRLEIASALFANRSLAVHDQHSNAELLSFHVVLVLPKRDVSFQNKVAIENL